jgi:asparagine synthase (glutamine-hydrolysing)
LVDGRLIVDEYVSSAAPQRADQDLADAVRNGVRVVRSGVEACASAYPEAAIELSGGLDSRIILAALLSAGHKPTEALTLGEATHPDVVLASELATGAGIGHRRVDLADLKDLDPDEALSITDSAGRRRDYSDNCVSLGVLDWVESSFGGGVRFSGQNGELARGFYYAFQPAWPRTADVLARALVRWRLIANERVSSALFDPTFRALGERHATATTRAFLERTSCDWLVATDLLYLYWRMQRWVGSDWTAAAQSRVILAPFFNSAYVTWALSAAPHHKRGSRLLARVLRGIDPDLAQIPTADGRPPAAFFDPSLTGRAQHLTRTARKIGVKLRQRMGDANKPPVGADALSRLALDAMQHDPVRLERVAAMPFVSRQYIEQLAQGTAHASPATVGLLIALSGLADGTTRPAGKPPAASGRGLAGAPK